MRSVAYINIYIYIHTQPVSFYVLFKLHEPECVFCFSVQYCLYEMINDLQSMSSFVHQLENNFFTNCTTKETSAVKILLFRVFFFNFVYQKRKKRASNLYNSTCVIFIILTINVLNEITLAWLG